MLQDVIPTVQPMILKWDVPIYDPHGPGLLPINIPLGARVVHVGLTKATRPGCVSTWWECGGEDAPTRQRILTAVPTGSRYPELPPGQRLRWMHRGTVVMPLEAYDLVYHVLEQERLQ
jgi:hypothetical protein